MELLLVLLVVAAAAAAVVVGVVRGRRTPTRPRPEPWPEGEGEPLGRTIVLDVDAADPDSPALQRLVEELAWQALRAEPDLDRVEVRSRDGARLGVVIRPERRQLADLPGELYEPHRPRHAGPSVVEGRAPAHPHHPPDESDLVAEVPRRRPFVDQFDLPDDVRRRLTRPDSPLDVVRAILEATGRDVEVQGQLLRVGDVGITVATGVLDRPNEALNEAFLRCREAGVTRGIVIRLGWVRADELRAREAAAPWVRHVDATAIQRMADAVAVGADPVGFAVGPQLVR